MDSGSNGEVDLPSVAEFEELPYGLDPRILVEPFADEVGIECQLIDHGPKSDDFSCKFASAVLTFPVSGKRVVPIGLTASQLDRRTRALGIVPDIGRVISDEQRLLCARSVVR